MFGQHFMIKAPAIVDDRRGAVSFFDAVTSPLAVLSRMGMLISSTHFFSVFVTESSPTMSTHEPLSTARHRDPAATSPDKEESEARVKIGVSYVALKAPLGST